MKHNLPVESEESIKKTIEWTDDITRRFADMIKEKNKTQYIVYMKEGIIFKRTPEGVEIKIS